MAMNTVLFTRDKAQLTSDKLKAKLVAKFSAAKIGNVSVKSDGRVYIEAELTAAQWMGVKEKLETVGYFMEVDPSF